MRPKLSSSCTFMIRDSDQIHHIRPYPLENSGSRPLSHRQASEGQTSSWVGDDQRIPWCCMFFNILFLRLRLSARGGNLAGREEQP